MRAGKDLEQGCSWHDAAVCVATASARGLNATMRKMKVRMSVGRAVLKLMDSDHSDRCSVQIDCKALGCTDS